ncbi:hypothetical protein [Roseivivax sp. CAU 1753]
MLHWVIDLSAQRRDSVDERFAGRCHLLAHAYWQQVCDLHDRIVRPANVLERPGDFLSCLGPLFCPQEINRLSEETLRQRRFARDGTFITFAPLVLFQLGEVAVRDGLRHRQHFVRLAILLLRLLLALGDGGFGFEGALLAALDLGVALSELALLCLAPFTRADMLPILRQRLLGLFQPLPLLLVLSQLRVVRDGLADLFLPALAPLQPDPSRREPGADIVLTLLVVADHRVLRGPKHHAPVFGDGARQDHGVDVIGLLVTVSACMDAVVSEGLPEPGNTEPLEGLLAGLVAFVEGITIGPLEPLGIGRQDDLPQWTMARRPPGILGAFYEAPLDLARAPPLPEPRQLAIEVREAHPLDLPANELRPVLTPDEALVQL